MFGWLFGSNDVVIVEEPKFSNLPVGEEFKKLDSDVVYVKTSLTKFETTNNSWHPIKWYQANEDFLVRT